MKTSSVSRRYARALFDILEPDQIVSMDAGLRDLSQALMASISLQHVLASPVFGSNQKMAVLTELSAKAGCHPIVKGFLGQLLAKNRVDQLPGIVKAFSDLVNHAKGSRQVTVVSATELEPTMKAEIQERLRTLMKGAVEITYTNEPKLFAGLRIRIGSTVYDSSLRNRLDTMRGMLSRE